ncbi:hypothetical protein LWI28_002516 [Acer negundo]|uniref:Uncharacterized protein n=1 Tax=Acer negundo TaxID=4023 RepID=A0AAD5NFU9_ACENE|nr:hypothetical protein LWI28_002516 [Acer negundo]
MGKRCDETSVSVEKVMVSFFKCIMKLESQKTALELRRVDLEKREARNENDRKTLAEEIEQIAVRNGSLQLASVEQQKAGEDDKNLAEGLKVLKFYVLMECHNYEEELKKGKLEEEIGYRNQQLSSSELGHKFNDTKETFLKLIAGYNFKDRRLMVLEQIHRDDISSRDNRLFKLDGMFNDSSATVRQFTSEKSKLPEEYIREIKRLQSINDKLKDDMNCQKKELEQQAKELEECKAQNDLGMRNLMDEIEKVIKFYVQMEYHNYEEELKKERCLVTILEEEIGYRNQQLSELEHKFNDSKETFLKLIVEHNFKDRRLIKLERKYYNSYAIVRQLTKIRRLQSINDELQDDMNRQKKELEQQAKELEECKAQNDLERTSLMDEIQKLKGKLQNQKPAESDSNLNAHITALRDQLEEKTEALQYLETLNHTLTLKESMSNQELQDARKESISV